MARDQRIGGPRAFKLGDRAKDVHLQLAGGSRRVDAFAEAHEPDSERVELLEQHDQVSEVASEAIEPRSIAIE
jgi:hypothetical protein